MLDHRLRSWPSIKSAMAQRLTFAGCKPALDRALVGFTLSARVRLCAPQIYLPTAVDPRAADVSAALLEFVSLHASTEAVSLQLNIQRKLINMNY